MQFVKDEVYIHCMDARIQKEKNSNAWGLFDFAGGCSEQYFW